MFGVQLPLNFDSPYKALNIIEFWRRWHMTLSRFLRDYLYIPLGGNRQGRGAALRQPDDHHAARRAVAWRGLDLRHVGRIAWLAARGSQRLALHHRRFGLHAKGLLATPLRALAWAVTFLAVVVGWVFFRAQDLPTAWSLLKGMAGQHGALLPDQLLAMAPFLRHVAEGAGTVPYLADGTVMGLIEMAAMIVLGLLLVLFTPAMHELRA